MASCKEIIRVGCKFCRHLWSDYYSKSQKKKPVGGGGIQNMRPISLLWRMCAKRYMTENIALYDATSLWFRVDLTRKSSSFL